MDGKVNAENYPESFKYLSAVNNTLNSMEREVETGSDALVVLSNLTKSLSFLTEFNLAASSKDYNEMEKVLEGFTGVHVDLKTAELEMKEYLKNKIDEM